MALLDDLTATPGLYLGRCDGVESGPCVGRIDVHPLPGGAVSFDYEAVSYEHILQHAEHTVLARRGDNRLALFVSHVESPTLSVMPEALDDPGWFLALEDGVPLTMGIRIEVPGPGRLVYAWWWAPPGEPVIERSRAELSRL